MKKQKEDLSGINDYILRLAIRIADLEKDSKTIIKNCDQIDKSFHRTASNLKTEIAHFRENVSKTNKVVNNYKKIIANMIKDFKGVGKQERFIRLKDKIDEWAPETFITKEELKKSFQR
ncbi:hypothetical protein CMO90_03605 [Candidatus Woesearchaeota archaeon]|jgi:hypothetical protein|nr:hypothetical protein [Candidatus Woesearchaeota archaeon]|tara:strand:+ start:132 stop:488 length:357 start_codon:yes stop_codon:yes gene_type:complete